MKKLSLYILLATASAFTATAQSDILKIALNNGSTQKIKVADIKEMTFEDIPAVGEAGDVLLDIVFNADGTATDASPLQNSVKTYPGGALMTYYNEMHGRYVASFANPLAGTVTDSYYRVNYEAGGEFINRIADGCTMETTIKLNQANPGTAEVKWFGSIQLGGIGFLLPVHSTSKCLTFLPNISTTGSSKYIWTLSDVEPVPGNYYHVVGVWNKEEGKSYVYINGRLAGTAAAPGDYVPVSKGAESFVIGGDPGNDQVYCTNSWNGEIVTARIYDTPYTADQVKNLWNENKFDESAPTVTVTDLSYMPVCDIATGCGYRIYGKGFQTGDIIEMTSLSTGAVIKPECVIASDAATLTIPAGFTSGDYRLILRRGSAQAPLCKVTYNIKPSLTEFALPKVIAHRGAHTDGRSENSVAALEAALDRNYYGIELDAWITTDGQVVVHHDGVANGLTFQNCTYNQIKDITLSNGEKLPTFDSFINSFVARKGTSTSKLIIEVKTHNQLERSKACVDRIMKFINDNGLKDRVEFIAFSYDVCKYIHQLDPDYMIGYLAGDRTPAVCMADGIRSIDYSYAAFGTHPEYIRQALDLGMTVNVWTINTDTEMLKYWGMGVNYITTDAPALLEELCHRDYIINQ